MKTGMSREWMEMLWYRRTRRSNKRKVRVFDICKGRSLGSQCIYIQLLRTSRSEDVKQWVSPKKQCRRNRNYILLLKNIEKHISKQHVITNLGRAREMWWGLSSWHPSSSVQPGQADRPPGYLCPGACECVGMRLWHGWLKLLLF